MRISVQRGSNSDRGRKPNFLVIPLALVLWVGTLCVPEVRAQVSPSAPATSPGVTVNFVTTASTPLNPGFNGFNGNMKNAVEYCDTNFQRNLATLSPGWLRFPGGTDSEAFNWATGEIVSAWIDALAAKQYTHDINANAQPIVAGKGGAWNLRRGVHYANVDCAGDALCRAALADPILRRAVL